MIDDAQTINNSRLVDVEWKLLYQLSSKNLNKVFQPRFQLTLIMLTVGPFGTGGAIEKVKDCGSKRETLRLKREQIECDQEELTHMLYKIKGACNALESVVKSSSHK